MVFTDFLLRFSLAIGLGLVIGFERQWRQRSAGLRTNTLVAMGAAAFTLISFGFTAFGKVMFLSWETETPEEYSLSIIAFAIVLALSLQTITTYCKSLWRRPSRSRKSSYNNCCRY